MAYFFEDYMNGSEPVSQVSRIYLNLKTTRFMTIYRNWLFIDRQIIMQQTIPEKLNKTDISMV